eukprot:jgi/Bigna1/78942/fgenesh1_pg.58_\
MPPPLLLLLLMMMLAEEASDYYRYRDRKENGNIGEGSDQDEELHLIPGGSATSISESSPSLQHPFEDFGSGNKEDGRPNDPIATASSSRNEIKKTGGSEETQEIKGGRGREEKGSYIRSLDDGESPYGANSAPEPNAAKMHSIANAHNGAADAGQEQEHDNSHAVYTEDECNEETYSSSSQLDIDHQSCVIPSHQNGHKSHHHRPTTQDHRSMPDDSRTYAAVKASNRRSTQDCSADITKGKICDNIDRVESNVIRKRKEALARIRKFAKGGDQLSPAPHHDYECIPPSYHGYDSRVASRKHGERVILCDNAENYEKLLPREELKDARENRRFEIYSVEVQKSDGGVYSSARIVKAMIKNAYADLSSTNFGYDTQTGKEEDGTMNNNDSTLYLVQFTCDNSIKAECRRGDIRLMKRHGQTNPAHLPNGTRVFVEAPPPSSFSLPSANSTSIPVDENPGSHERIRGGRKGEEGNAVEEKMQHKLEEGVIVGLGMRDKVGCASSTALQL